MKKLLVSCLLSLVTVGAFAADEKSDWILNIRAQCTAANKTFWFKNTGSLFRRNGVTERINPFKETGIAKELNINISDGKRLF